MQSNEPTKANRLGTEKVSRLLPGFAIPSIIAMLVNALYNIVDQIFIGNGVGYLGNAATNVAFPLSTIALSVALLLGQGGASKQNLELGAGRQERANKTVGNMITMQILFSVVLLVLSLLLLEPMLHLFGSTPDVLPFAMDYTQIIVLGLPFVIISTGLNHSIRADGSPVYSMASMLVGAVLNTILDPLFIFGFHWGMQGAAWATVIGQVAGCIMSALYLPRYKHVKLTKSAFRLDRSICGSICSLGVASFANQLAMCVVQIVMNNSMTYYGALSAYGKEIPLACVGIVMKVNMIFMAVVIGIGQGSQPIVSYNYGARNYKRVRETYLLAALSATLISVVVFVVFQLFPHQIISLFGEGSPAYFRFAERCFRIFLFMTFVNGIQPVTTVFFTSIGKAAKGIFIALTRQIICLVPLILLFPLFWGIDGIMYAAPVADAAAFVLAAIFVYREFQKMRRMEKETVKA